MKRWLSCTILALAASAGCGDSDGISLVPVAGTVTMDGKPLEGATISFVPDPKNKPSTMGTDITGPGGEFKVKYRNRPGLSPGKYKVVVEAEQAKSKGKQLPDAIAKDPYMAKLAGISKDDEVSRYADVAKTPFEQDVSAKGESGLTFDLKSTAKK